MIAPAAFFTAPWSSRLAAACTIFSSVMPAPPSPLHFGEPRLWRRDHFGKRAEFREQHLGERLDIAAWQRSKQQ
jgi:hypothetical protein